MWHAEPRSLLFCVEGLSSRCLAPRLQDKKNYIRCCEQSLCLNSHKHNLANLDHLNYYVFIYKQYGKKGEPRQELILIVHTVSFE